MIKAETGRLMEANWQRMWRRRYHCICASYVLVDPGRIQRVDVVLAQDWQNPGGLQICKELVDAMAAAN